MSLSIQIIEIGLVRDYFIFYALFITNFQRHNFMHKNTEIIQLKLYNTKLKFIVIIILIQKKSNRKSLYRRISLTFELIWFSFTKQLLIGTWYKKYAPPPTIYFFNFLFKNKTKFRGRNQSKVLSLKIPDFCYNMPKNYIYFCIKRISFYMK